MCLVLVQSWPGRQWGKCLLLKCNKFCKITCSTVRAFISQIHFPVTFFFYIYLNTTRLHFEDKVFGPEYHLWLMLEEQQQHDLNHSVGWFFLYKFRYSINHIVKYCINDVQPPYWQENRWNQTLFFHTHTPARLWSHLKCRGKVVITTSVLYLSVPLGHREPLRNFLLQISNLGRKWIELTV